MPNYDDLFSTQPAPQGGESFDKDAWAAKKQHERDQVYGLIDAYVREGKPTEDLDEVILMTIDAPTKREKRRADREAR